MPNFSHLFSVKAVQKLLKLINNGQRVTVKQATFSGTQSKVFFLFFLPQGRARAHI